MNVLRVDASIQGPASASSALADLVTTELVDARPDVTVVRRHLGAEPLPADAWATAVGAGFTPEADRTPEQHDALALAGSVAEELRSADAAVLALPLYNWGVSQHVKTWIDLAIAGGGAGTPLLEGTPTVLLTTRGGSYAPGTPKEGWDHSIDYLRRILADVWKADLTVIEREFTLVGVNPALDEFTEAAALLKKEADASAVAAGRALAAR
ncbi:FMN-dependent NADH-azoreductase [Luteimicrobium album]|uniref:FMN dependent NADH:quinone oxidoreductase n=1 Tax=Luteimicrobium album TaxID=1054550 RepID=A0ABQ6I2T8_9MICO|nr:NAD(P)H-dependent oxidoreductase [Luteimicrobium album]GMA24557.1 FMN-dependent NADH-azoreductase [Luteimicrobium album]